MVGVLVDSCGWVSLVDAGLNIDYSLEEVIGEAELKITSRVREELESLSSERRGLLLSLLLDRAELIEVGDEHTDDSLVTVASEKSWPVLTVDRVLKRRLSEAGCSYIEVTSGPSLRLVET